VEAECVLQEPSTLLSDPDLHFSVLIVSEIRLFGEGLAQALARSSRLFVCGFCADLDDAFAKISQLQPDIVLFDAALGNGSDAIARMRSIAPRVRVVALAVCETPQNIIAWAEAGAAGYIPNTAGLSEVVPLLTDVMRGEQSCSRAVAGGLLRRLFEVACTGTRRTDAPPGPMLTKREIEILQLVNDGFSNKEIARRLNIGLATTKSHVHNLLGKLALQRRNEAAAWMRRQPIRIGMLPPVLPPSVPGSRV